MAEMNLVFFILYMIISVIVPLGFYILYFIYFRRNKFRAFILTKVQNGYRIVKTVWKKVGLETFNFKDGSYQVDLTYSIEDEKKRPILMYEKGKVDPIPFTDKFLNLKGKSAEGYKKVLNDHRLEELTSGYKNKLFLIIIIALIAVICIITIYSFYNTNLLNERILGLVKNMTKVDNGGIIIR